MQRQYLDAIDIKIINILSRDCRQSFMSIGSIVGLTSKSVKSRVDKMISTGIIQEFVVRVNPVMFGYEMTCILIVREYNENTDNIINRLNLLGDVILHSTFMGGISTFCLAIKEGKEDKVKLLPESLKPANVNIIFTSKLSSFSESNRDELTETDLRIIKCLVSNPKLDINEIAKKTSISSRTVNRRLSRLKENNVLKFSILCNPIYTLGYIQFVLIINTIDKFSHKQIVERIYQELGENILCQPPIINPDDLITLVLFSQDIFTADSILKKIESFIGVKRVELYILKDTIHYNEWLLKEINKRMNIVENRIHNQEIESSIEMTS